MANMAQAVRMALHYGETHLGVTDVFGEDVGAPLGGVFTATQGLKTAWTTALDAYGLVLAAIKDPNPVLVLLPKALMRAKDTRLIPGEPADSDELGRMIDAPIGDRSNWQPQWPELEDSTIKIGEAALVREG